MKRLRDVQDASSSEEDDNPTELLEAMGFSPEAVAAALKVHSGFDEALDFLETTASEIKERTTSSPPSATTPDSVFESDGFLLIVDGNVVRMHPPWAAECVSDRTVLPICGSRHKDGSMVLEPMDSWKLELYDATPLPKGSPGHIFNCDKPFVVPNFFDLNEVNEAKKRIDELDQAGRLSHKRAYTSAASKKRDDKVAFVEMSGSDSVLVTIAKRLAEEARRLFPERQLLMPKHFMIAIYDGNGARYAAHRDNEFSEGKWMNYRSVTCLAYLTPGLIQTGHLRILYPSQEGEAKTQDIPPTGGTAVFFDAKTLLHEVLPTTERRLSLTFWLLEVTT